MPRALTVVQDTAMRDKRRALGRTLASAVTDSGTKVDDELLFIPVHADPDPPHIQCLRIMADGPPHLDAISRQRLTIGESPVRQWHPSDIAHQDPGLKDSVWALLPVLASHQLIYGGDMVLTRAGREPEQRVARRRWESQRYVWVVMVLVRRREAARSAEAGQAQAPVCGLFDRSCLETAFEPLSGFAVPRVAHARQQPLS
jgi:hypothetical protein